MLKKTFIKLGFASLIALTSSSTLAREVCGEEIDLARYSNTGDDTVQAHRKRDTGFSQKAQNDFNLQEFESEEFDSDYDRTRMLNALWLLKNAGTPYHLAKGYTDFAGADRVQASCSLSACGDSTDQACRRRTKNWDTSNFDTIYINRRYLFKLHVLERAGTLYHEAMHIGQSTSTAIFGGGHPEGFTANSPDAAKVMWLIWFAANGNPIFGSDFREKAAEIANFLIEARGYNLPKVEAVPIGHGDKILNSSAEWALPKIQTKECTRRGNQIAYFTFPEMRGLQVDVKAEIAKHEENRTCGACGVVERSVTGAYSGSYGGGNDSVLECGSGNIRDRDLDGVYDYVDGIQNDNCLTVPNADQADVDNDGLGDACDTRDDRDRDGDGVRDALDNCPTVSNRNQADMDQDGIGDFCDNDSDNDGIDDSVDNCPARDASLLKWDSNPDQKDMDGDGQGDLCDEDADGDGIPYGVEQHFNTSDLDRDSDNDGVEDGDGVNRAVFGSAPDISLYLDNCPRIPNANQSDLDNDGIGDVCDSQTLTDQDNDKVFDNVDNCPSIANANQANLDNDQYGDVCDSDMDGDGVLNSVEEALGYDPRNKNSAPRDSDRDGSYDSEDNCRYTHNSNQSDRDRDGEGDACDDDIDGDGVSNTDETNAGSDPYDSRSTPDTIDSDNDGIQNSEDNCPSVSNPEQWDRDKDGIGSACDGDIDGDGIVNDLDNCKRDANPGQWDKDSDGYGNECDWDIDGDDIANKNDNCKWKANPGQWDRDQDGIGNACDRDIDGDGFTNKEEKAAGTKVWNAESYPGNP